ncbi:MAG: fatty acid CoA ligase family protein [Anaerolineae bacterium]
MTTASEIYNVATSLAVMAERAPYQPGVVFPAGRDKRGRAKSVTFTFRQLNEECDRYAHGLSNLGIGRGDRVLLLLRPGVELLAAVFALVKMGAVPVLIDPGMGRRAFVRCVADTEPTALIGVPVAHLLRRLAPRPFASVRHTVVAGRKGSLSSFLAETTLEDVRARDRGPFAAAPTTTASEAAVAFTSGSTGVPKGVVYRHGMFEAQIALLRDAIGIQPGEVDLALLYIFALFNPALGVTTIIPDMDPTKSAEVNPAYVVEAVQTHGVTNAFGSPTIWKRVAPYCVERNIRLPSLKRVLMAGAPVPPDLIETMLTSVLGEGAEILTPFGATEAMPLTSISGDEIVAETTALTAAGRGMCVGRPLPGVTLRVIKITESAIPEWDERLILPQNEIGEIVVKGPMVTDTYVGRPDETALAKIREGSAIWHRMGDLGYFDDAGRLWFCGRKSHRVVTADGTLYPVLCETIYNQHPDVRRTALVGVGERGSQRPILVVEPQPGRFPLSVLAHQRFAMELLALGAECGHTRGIDRVLFYPDVFPTDVRHNAKIQREKLAVWATAQERRYGRGAPARIEKEVEAAARARPQKRLGDLLRALGLAAGLAVSGLLLLKRLRRSKQGATDSESEKQAD